MNPIDSYKNSYKSSENKDFNNFSTNQNTNNNLDLTAGLFENFPLSTRLSSKDNLRVLEDRNLNPFNLENKALASADLFQNTHKQSNNKQTLQEDNQILNSQYQNGNLYNRQNSNNNFLNTKLPSDNVREDTNQRLQNFSPMPTNSCLPIAKNVQRDNRISYPIQTRNMNYNSLNSELEKKNSERSNFEISD